MGDREPTYYDSCLTVKELKALIKDWPEEDQFGEPSEVWVMTGPSSSRGVKEVWPLNSTDIVFDSAIQEEKALEDEPS